MMLDVVIIGGGVIGCSIARELSKYQLKIAVVEAKYDVAKETSGANTGIVHCGYDPEPGTLMAKLNAEGNLLFEQLAEDLNFAFLRNGSVLVAFNDADLEMCGKLLQQATLNHVEGLYHMTPEEIWAMEPNISRDIVGGLFLPNGVVSPFEMTVALIENAVANGTQLYLENTVTSIQKTDEGFVIETDKGLKLESRLLINSAGLHAGDISEMAGGESFQVTPRRGDYLIFDKKCGDLVSRTIFPCPGPMGKGVLITYTTEGNILVGPTSIDTDSREDTATRQEELDKLWANGDHTLTHLPPRNMNIANYVGIRAIGAQHDFYIKPSKQVDGLLNLVGISSPGLTSAPALSIYVVDMLRDMGLELEPKPDFHPRRKGIQHFFSRTWEQRKQLIDEDPHYGRIVCRCETVTEGEIVDAIHRSPRAIALDSIKHRTRAGTGRCQGGFCTCRVLEIISRETGIPIEQIKKGDGDSYVVLGKLKEFSQDSEEV